MHSFKFAAFRSDQIKLPFPSTLAPLIVQNEKLLKRICFVPMLNIYSTYVGLLGLFGTALSLFDIVRIVKSGSVLPQTLWRSRLQAGKIVSTEAERDFKLISLVISLESYILLTIGAITQQPIFLLPWLGLYAFIILLECFVLISRISVEGLVLTKHGLLLSMFVVYNWLSIACTFFKIIYNSCYM